MADLTAAADLRVLGEAVTEQFEIETTAARTIYKGQPLIIDQDVDATGPVVPFIDALTVAATDVFMGIAAENKSVAIAAVETTLIVAYIGPTIVGFKSTVFTEGADNGAEVYMSDSGTLSATIGDNPRIGKVHKVEDGYCWVELSSPYICAGA